MLLKVILFLKFSSTSGTLDCPSDACPESSRGDCNCDLSCMSPPCSYDSSLTSSSAADQLTASDCFSDCPCNDLQLGNSVCDSTCDIAECGWDLGDCGYCASGCFESDLADTDCKDECNTEACNHDNGHCPCAADCSDSDLADTVCQDECNIEACNYDNGHCACATGCEITTLGTCASECMVAACDFDPGCSDEFVKMQAIVYQALKDDYTATYDFATLCENLECTLDDLEAGLLFDCRPDKCNSLECLYQLGGCTDSTVTGNDESCTDENCTRCSNNDKSFCFECGTGKIAQTGQCLDACTVSFESLSFASINAGSSTLSYEACVPSEDTSTAESPAILTADPAVADSLKDSIALVWQTYTNITLSQGTYNISEIADPVVDQFNDVHLTIQCDNCAEKAVVNILNTDVNLALSGLASLTVMNVEFNGKFALNNSCTENLCYYCPYTEQQGSDYINDKEEIIADPSLYNIDACSNRPSGLFYATYGITFENVEFNDIRYNSEYIVRSISGDLVMKSVDFTNVLAKTVVVYHECTGCVFEFTDSKVSNVNFGYEHVTNIDQKGFLELTGQSTVTIDEIVFENNVILCNFASSSCASFIKLSNVQQLVFTNNDFILGVLIGSLLEIDQSSFSVNTFTSDSQDNCVECNLLNINIDNNDFQNIGSKESLIIIIMGSYTQNGQFQNNRITNVLNNEDFLRVVKNEDLTDADMNGETFTTTIDSNSVDLTALAKHFTIFNNQFTDWRNSRTLNIQKISTLTIRDTTLGSLSTGTNINDILALYKALPDAYLTQDIPDVTDVTITGFVHVDSSFKVTLDNLSTSTYQDNQYIVKLNKLIGDTTISPYTIADIVTEHNGYLFEVIGQTGTNLAVSGLSFSRITNGSGTGIVNIEEIDTLTMSGCVFSNIEADLSGAVAMNNVNSATLRDIDITDIDTQSGAITLTNGSSATLEDIDFNNINAEQSGAIVLNADTVSLNTITFTNVETTQSEVIALTIGSSATLEGITFNQITTTQSGVIALTNGNNANLRDISFTDVNTGQSGVIDLNDADIVELNNISFTNTNTQSGVLALTKATSATLGNISFTNVDTEQLGAIDFNDVGTVNFDTVTFSDIETQSGVITLTKGTSATLENIIFTNIDTEQSGAIDFTDVGTVNFDTGTFSDIETQSGVITLTKGTSATLENISFTTVTTEQSGAIDLNDVGTVNLDAVTFSGIETQSGVITLTTGTSATLENISFTTVTTEQSGAIDFTDVDTVNLNTVSFSTINPKQSGAIALSNAKDVTLEAIIIRSVDSDSGNGAGIYVMFATQATGFSIKNSIIEDCTTGGRGGGIYLTSSGETTAFEFTYENTDINRVSSSTGDFLYIDNGIQLTTTSTLIDSDFTNGTGNTSGFYLSHSSGKISVSNCKFTSNTGQGVAIQAVFTSGDFLSLTNVEFTNNSGEGIISVLGADSTAAFSTSDCTFENNEGLVLRIVTSQWSDTNSVIQNNKSVFLLQTDSKGVLQGTIVKTNSGDFIGLATYHCEIQCNTCNFENNTSKNNGGALSIESSSKSTIISTNFTANTSQGSGSAIAYTNNVDNHVIQSSLFTNNVAAKTSTIYIIGTEVTMTDCDVKENTAPELSSGVLINSGTLTIDRTDFEDQTGETGTYVYGTAQSSVTISNSNFLNGVSTSGAAINLSSTSLVLSNSKIYDCSSQGFAAGIFVSSGTTVDISGTEFRNITSRGIYAEGGTFNIRHSTFSNMTDGNSFKFLDKLDIANTVFEDIHGTTPGGTLFLDEVVSIQLSQSTFQNSSSTDNGGCLYVTSLPSRTSGNKIEACVFKNCTAKDLGGAIYVQDATINIKGNTFDSNSIEGSGGGVFTSCPSKDCATQIIENVFKNNTAALNGGGIYWTENEPITDNNSYEQNVAVYGPDRASYPVRMGEYPFVSGRRDETKILASSQGLDPPPQVALIDHYEQVVTTAVNFFVNVKVIGDQASIQGEVKYIAELGIFTISETNITAYPDTYVDLNLFSTEVENLKISDDTTELNITYFSRPCEIGEYFSFNECILCEPDFYSFDTAVPCKKCMTGATCYGGHQVAPNPGYWRDNWLSEELYECLNSDACDGGLRKDGSLDYIPTGECAEGYQGRLCQPCGKDYSSAGKNKCGGCPNQTANIIILCIICIGFFLLIAIMVRSSIISAYKPAALHSIYFKIFANYLQLVMLTAQFRLDWPGAVAQMLEIQEESGSVADQLFSFDCFIFTDDEDAYKEVFFTNMIIMAVVPAFLCLLALLFWYIASRVKSDPDLMKSELVTTICVVFFFIHPMVTKEMFSIYACMEVEGEQWLLTNLDIKCWNDKHTTYGLLVALPAIVIWVLAVPAVVVVFLSRRKKQLTLTKQKVKFGFLYNGFRVDKYYWEFVILYRKILIISCAVFLTNISIPVQALIVFMILMVCLHLQYTVQPYDREQLNQMELRAIMVATITIYCGLFYLTNDLGSESKYVLLGLMVFVNVYFLIYWLYHLLFAAIVLISEYVPYLKMRLNQNPGNDKPLMSLVNDQDDEIDQDALNSVLEFQKPRDFYLHLVANRLKETEEQEEDMSILVSEESQNGTFKQD